MLSNFVLHYITISSFLCHHIAVHVEVIYFDNSRKCHDRYERVACEKDINCTVISNPITDPSTTQKRYQDNIRVTMLNFNWWKNETNICHLMPNLTIVSTREAMSNYHFYNISKYFDGIASTNPNDDVQFTYWKPVNKEQLYPLRKFNDLIKGGSYVASACNYLDGHKARNNIIKQLRNEGIRVDGLGQCLHTSFNLENNNNSIHKNKTIEAKLEAQSKYMFYFAFENTIEPGYVTEKAFQTVLTG